MTNAHDESEDVECSVDEDRRHCHRGFVPPPEPPRTEQVAQASGQDVVQRDVADRHFAELRGGYLRRPGDRVPAHSCRRTQNGEG